MLIYLFLVLIIIAAFALKVFVEAQSKQKSTGTLPYERGKLLSANELAFFNVLHPLAASQWHLFTKVRLEDIIKVRNGLERKQYNSSRGRIKSRHIDFILCDKDTLEVLMCIELDDKSHSSAKAKEADQFKNNALKAAGVDLIRIPAQRTYTEAYLKGYLFEESDSTVAPVNSAP